MNLIAINDAFRALISDPTSQAAFCDDRGNVLGYYVPVKPPTPEAYARLRAAFTDEELELASREPRGRTLQEIMRDLERLK